MPEYPRLCLPPASLRVKRCDDGLWRVYDRLRDRFVALTPEEWVRQHFVDFLICQLGYPPGMLANEVALSLNSTRRRCDTVLFAPPGHNPGGGSGGFTLGNLRPLAIVEYKAPEVEITQKVFDQIARYNLVMGAPLLIVSNGLRHFCCVASPDGYRFLRDIPAYGDLLRLTSAGEVSRI
ncbi:MAG: type I restriction enzyme HsdR N-terminal domain-containing protein [Muribaculaceae bacterium]|nr:type I restriction enzyme HsdR N-terminal domain-containing protein [Muribaculaceae bacterium]MDE6359676.1 type I restriction enzyme HsdR N-terminal domain-containing protein [Muribaculaceae bacterium]